MDHAVACFVAPFRDAGFVDEDGAAIDRDREAAAFQRLDASKGGRKGGREGGRVGKLNMTDP